MRKEDTRQTDRIHFHTDESQRAETGAKKAQVSALHFQKAERRHEKGFSGVIILALILIFLFIFSLIFLVSYRQWSFDPAYLFENISRNFKELFALVFGMRPAEGMAGRLLQVSAAVLCGAALSSCGAVLQGSMRNTLAGPSTMGVMTGGTLGILFYLLVFTEAHPEIVATERSAEDIEAFLSRSLLQTYAQQLCVFAGCILAVALILGISLAAGKGRVSASAMIISGTVFSAAIGNLVQLVQYYMLMKDPTDVRIDAIREMMLGNFNGITSFRTLAMMGVPILICIVLLLVIRNRLNLLSFGEDEAAVMGVNLMRYRVFMIIISTILTACVVSFCGRIGFLGFMVPLIGRKIAGANMKYLIPACMLIGAVLMLVIYDAAYFAGMQDSLNIFTSSIGCLVMIGVLIRRKGDKSGAAFQGRGQAGMGIRP